MIGSRAVPVSAAIFCVGFFACLAGLLKPAAAADAYFKDKQIRLIVGSAPGGTYDLLARAVARHIVAHIPGNPSIIVQNQPSASGLVMTNQLYAVGPNDGTAIGVPINAIPAAPLNAPRAAGAPAVGNVHDFVNEMVVGTWLAFGREGNAINARLSWVSPLRGKYIFTSRARSKAIVVTPEELAWQLGAGKASLVVEPVPLFDRAVSAALDTLAAARAPSPAAPPA